VVVVP